MIRKTQVSRIITELKEIRRASTMDTVDFGGRTHGAGFPKNNSQITNFIKKVTGLWRYTWITDPLDRAIDQLEHELNR